MMDKAFELGINFLDTADAYARGKCEEIWGEMLAKRKRRITCWRRKCFFRLAMA